MSASLQPGDRVVLAPGHPQEGRGGVLVAYERFGLSSLLWRVALDRNTGECYAKDRELMQVRRIK